MFEKFLTDGAGDFRQRYLNTFGFFRNEGKRLLTKIVAIDRAVKFEDKDGISYTLNPDAEADIGFEFLPPKAAWHNTSKGAFLVRRVPARQWRRGICSANTNIGTPLGHREVVDFPMLAEIYEKSMSKEEALKAFNTSTTRCVALSDQFAIEAKSGYLFCLDSVIGKFKKSNEVFEVDLADADLWRTEVKDAFSRSNLTATIK